MVARSLKLFLALFFVAGFYALSQTENLKKSIEQEGKSTEISQAFAKKEIQPFIYLPVVEEFWKESETQLSEKKFELVIEKATKQIQSYGDTTPEGFEGKLVRAMAFQGAGFPSYAFDQFVDVAANQKGTHLGNFALLMIGDHVKSYDYDKELIFNLLDNYEVENMHPDIESFLGYFRGIFLAKHGFDDWARESFLKISENSYWSSLKSYWTALAYVARGDMDKASEIFNTLSNLDNLESHLKDRVDLQRARIHFENGEFDDAFKLYEKKKNFGLREKGRQLLEKAWTKFYLGDYGRSLGILHALKAPLFEASQSYEQFILEMLIFRQLCHYELVEYSADIFRKRFGPTIVKIQNRKPLRNEKILFDMSVMSLDIQSLANVIGRMKLESSDLKNSEVVGKDLKKEVAKFYALESNRLQLLVDSQLDERLKSSANNLLKAEEQIKFLEYTSSLDALKLNQDMGEANYKAQKISKLKFEKMFWPVTSEYWYDELEDYSMQISSLCKTETNLDQKNLEENFE